PMTSLTIGRAPESGIVVSDAFPRVSNNHATIALVDGRLVYNDHSSNGTIINGNLVRHEQVELTNGDQILLAGEYLLAWPVLLNMFPDLQRRTLRFDANAAVIPSDVPLPASPATPPSSSSPEERVTGIWPPEQISPAHGGTFREAAPGMTGREPLTHGGTGREAFIPGQGASSEAGQLNSLTQSDIDDQLRKFNLGAFLGTWAWGLANRVYWPLAIIPLSLIPYVGQILSLFLCTYLGLNGNPLGWQHSRGVAFPIWRRRQRVWVFIGAAVFIICCVAQLFAFSYVTNMF
ncbi:MAG: FHA domain-containing protein, partial [Muribaculaceae bacterium]|nr:FHA domain-containing protein [Muribaculaceae bacterium]